ncbi:MAG: (2Fe-2S) ferredoxin domain-containing protein [Kiritimatiellaeota bacterium]|nr:(2Fe-2S) ferredoxin domain-containing protein [Kiritimatiellota bacterium]
MQQQPSPYSVHVFVCVNDRHGERKSCAEGGAADWIARLKERVQQNPLLKGRVRVSACGCLGLCAQGPNLLLHPQGLWFSGVGADDLGRVLAAIEARAGVPPTSDEVPSRGAI